MNVPLGVEDARPSCLRSPVSAISERTLVVGRTYPREPLHSKFPPFGAGHSAIWDRTQCHLVPDTVTFGAAHSAIWGRTQCLFFEPHPTTRKALSSLTTRLTREHEIQTQQEAMTKSMVK